MKLRIALWVGLAIYLLVRILHASMIPPVGQYQSLYHGSMTQPVIPQSTEQPRDQTLTVTGFGRPESNGLYTRPAGSARHDIYRLVNDFSGQYIASFSGNTLWAIGDQSHTWYLTDTDSPLSSESTWTTSQAVLPIGTVTGDFP
jgi:hypothetical protein